MTLRHRIEGGFRGVLFVVRWPAMGPNVKRLICEKAAMLMVPPGSGHALDAAVKAIMKPGNLQDAAKQATVWVEQVLALVKTAPDNTFGNDDEAIAGEIIRQIDERKKKARA